MDGLYRIIEPIRLEKAFEVTKSSGYPRICCNTWEYEKNFADGNIPMDLHSKRSAYSFFTQLKISHIHSFYWCLCMKQLWSKLGLSSAQHMYCLGNTHELWLQASARIHGKAFTGMSELPDGVAEQNTNATWVLMRIIKQALVPASIIT